MFGVFFLYIGANAIQKITIRRKYIDGALLVINMLERVEGDNALGFRDGVKRGNIIHNISHKLSFCTHLHEIRSHGGGLDRVRTTGLSSTPAHPKVAPPSHQNNRRSCARTQNARTSCAELRYNGGTNPDNGFCRCRGRIVKGL